MSPSPTVEPGDPERIADALAEEVLRRTGSGPAVVTCAPGRVNLIGEHLDYNRGRCLPLALPHATYVAAAPREDRVLSVTSLEMGETRLLPLDDLAPGAVHGWAAYVGGVLWAMAADGRPVPGMDVVVDSRVPLGAGLSSSAALECAVALAALELGGVPDTPQARRRLVEACVRAETEMVGAPTGGMDQSVALLAERGHALLLDFADGSSTPVPWTPEADGLTLLVVDTRVTHRLVDGAYAARRRECERAAHELGVSSLREVHRHPEVLDRVADPVVRRRARHVLTELDRVDAAIDLLARGDHAALGPLLDASHASLRDDFEVSCAELDVAVETCREHGALGARMTGGGFGGSTVALVPTGRVDETGRAVIDEFAARGWSRPGLLTAPASSGARRVR